MRPARRLVNSHDRAIMLVYERLKAKGTYKVLNIKREYNHNGFCGEFDLEGLTKRGYWHYYEFKTHYHRDAEMRAAAQFGCAGKAFLHERRWKYILVTNTDGELEFYRR